MAIQGGTMAQAKTLSDTELQSMYNDMTDTLEHNYSRLMNMVGK